ncbi:MAG: triphosphoribosyl-dephospho-CoA synthase [Blautia marasmi]
MPKLDAYFVQERISPGGSADMLALTYFCILLGFCLADGISGAV